MSFITEIKESLTHLVFPHVCEGCGSNVLNADHELCLYCLSILPATQFQLHQNNPVEKIFWGRLPVVHASAHFYFTKESMMQKLMHAFKYKRNKELGLYLGKLMGHALSASGRFNEVDCLVPLPLFSSKEKKRGYNQAAVLCDGIAMHLQKPVIKQAIIRNQFTESQTKKNRVDRWLNMEGRFEVVQPGLLAGKHVLLVDDVITTGATLEACGQEIIAVPDSKLSMATLCFSSGN
jgi:ComF family protein